MHPCKLVRWNSWTEYMTFKKWYNRNSPMLVVLLMCQKFLFPRQKHDRLRWGSAESREIRSQPRSVVSIILNHWRGLLVRGSIEIVSIRYSKYRNDDCDRNWLTSRYRPENVVQSRVHCRFTWAPNNTWFSLVAWDSMKGCMRNWKSVVVDILCLFTIANMFRDWEVGPDSGRAADS